MTLESSGYCKICIFVYLLFQIFLYSPVSKLTISMQTLQYQNVSNMTKTCEKNPYIGCIVHRRYILLVFNVHILFLLVYIPFLTFTTNINFFDLPFPPLIKTPLLIRYPGNFHGTILLRPPAFI